MIKKKKYSLTVIALIVLLGTPSAYGAHPGICEPIIKHVCRLCVEGILDGHACEIVPQVVCSHRNLGLNCLTFFEPTPTPIGDIVNDQHAPPRDIEKPIFLKDALIKAGMAKEEAQKLVNDIIKDIKLKKPGEEGNELIKLITGKPSPSKEGKLATTWANIKTKVQSR